MIKTDRKRLEIISVNNKKSNLGKYSLIYVVNMVKCKIRIQKIVVSS